jgi:LysR family transcriptional regulator for bpeEF and oprC
MSSHRDPFAGVLPFIATAEARSFREAARQHGVTPSSVSKSVAKLERDVGVRLLLRTSRTVAMTREGEAFLVRCRAAMDEMLTGREAASRSTQGPRGLLSVSMPPALARLVVIPALPAFLTRHPLLELKVMLADRFVRLAEEKIDVALRIGRVREMSLVARPLRAIRWTTLAAPSYLSRRGTPTAPTDLAGHEGLVFVLPDGTRQPWRFEVAKREISIEPRGRIASDDGMALVRAAVAGLGLVQAHDYMARGEVERGELVEVLADHTARGPELSVVSGERQNDSPRVQAFVQFALDLFGPRVRPSR